MEVKESMLKSQSHKTEIVEFVNPQNSDFKRNARVLYIFSCAFETIIPPFFSASFQAVLCRQSYLGSLLWYLRKDSSFDTHAKCTNYFD